MFVLIFGTISTLYTYSNTEPEAVNATHGYPVEMILDGAYHGLYILSDRIDRKQLKLKKKGGYLYKGKEWTDECKLQGINTPYSNSKQAWQGFESIIRTRWVKSNLNIFPILSSSSLQHQKKNLPPNMKSDWMFPLLIDYFILY